MQSDAPENKATPVIKIDRHELLATIDWLEYASKWFRQQVIEWRKTGDGNDDGQGYEDLYLKTEYLDAFMKGLEDSVEALQALKPS